MDAQLLGAIATSLAATIPATTLERPVGDHRSWERLLATDAYDAWLIRWPAGTSVGPHDHGGSAGAFTVVAGELVEIVSDPSGSTRVMTLGPGAQRGFGPDLVHDVANAGPHAAISVHVYSPPITTMTWYEWTPTTNDAVVPIPAGDPA